MQQKHLLENGMTLLTDPMNHVESVSLGIWLKMGSRWEKPDENGMFHFIEHTLFKGTPTRSARGIAEAIDGVGGILDAYTAKEETCYAIKIREKHFDYALEILADMLNNPAFDGEELDRERKVILEEIKMEEDNPEDVVFEQSLQRFWGNHPLGQPILGTPETVSSFTREQVQEFHQRFYRPEHMLVAAAGKIDPERLGKRLVALFPALPNKDSVEAQPCGTPMIEAFQIYQNRPSLEQVNFCLNLKGLPYHSPKRHSLSLLSTLFGGGPSSRLFQGIREERGLAYSVGCFTNSFSDSGQFTLYAGCSPESFEEVLALCFQYLKELKEEGVKQEELDRAREQYAAALVMGMESTQTRTAALAKHMLTLEEVFDMNRTISELEQVTCNDVHELVHELLDPNSLGLYAIGRLAENGPNKPWKL